MLAELWPQAITKAVLECLKDKETVSTTDIINRLHGWLNEERRAEPAKPALKAAISHLETLQQSRQGT
jgi:hypothetical protein